MKLQLAITKHNLLKPLLFMGWAIAFAPSLVDLIGQSDILRIGGLCLLPFILRVAKKDEHSMRMLWGVTIGGLLYYFFGQAYWLFGAGLYGLLFLIELYYGKLNAPAVLAPIFYLPFTSGLFNLFGFQIRLYLTKWAVAGLSLMGYATKSAGNLMEVNGEQFFVDTSCMGLRMVMTGFLLTLLLASQQEKRQAKELSMLGLLGLMGLGFIGIVLSNYFRIIALVVFKSPPETASHELIGIFCLLLFGVLPMLWISRWYVEKFGVVDAPKGTKKNSVFDLPFRQWIPAVPVLLLAVFNYGSFEKEFRESVPLSAQIALPQHYDLTKVDGRLLSLQKEETVLYIKGQNAMSVSNHNPLICWRSTGYSIIGEQVERVGDVEVYTAQLVKNGEVLHTAWWYKDGQEMTLSELDWRWENLVEGKRFCLYNVACGSREELFFEVNRLVSGNPKD